MLVAVGQILGHVGNNEFGVMVGGKVVTLSREQLNIWIGLQAKDNVTDVMFDNGYNNQPVCCEAGCEHKHKTLEDWNKIIDSLKFFGVVLDTDIKADVSKLLGMRLLRQGVGVGHLSECTKINTVLGATELNGAEAFMWMMANGEELGNMRGVLADSLLENQPDGLNTDKQIKNFLHEELIKVAKELIKIGAVVLL